MLNIYLLCEVSPGAAMALKAVAIKKQCGAYAARRYAEKMGVMQLYRLARQLDAATKAGF